MLWQLVNGSWWAYTYVAESIHRWQLMIAECFEPLSTAYNLMKAYVTETFLIDWLILLRLSSSKSNRQCLRIPDIYVGVYRNQTITCLLITLCQYPLVPYFKHRRWQLQPDTLTTSETFQTEHLREVMAAPKTPRKSGPYIAPPNA